MTLRVLLVDDNPRFLAAARALLEQEGFDVAAVASTISEAVERATEVDVDVALVDIDLGGESGFDLAQRLAQIEPPDRRPTIVLISTYAEQDLADLIQSSPAAGFVSKSELSGTAIRRLVES